MATAGDWIKLLIGIILILVGLWTLLPLKGILNYPYIGVGWDEFLIVLKGSAPLLLILTGLVLVWVEADEVKQK